MPEESKKPKIDLRARLGKKTVGAAGPSIPPPMTTGGGSIPAPPFASKAPEPEPEKPKVVEPQAIKIEMSEEVVQAQKKGKSKIIAIAVGTAVVGGILGYAFGGNAERGKKHANALAGAEMLTEEVDKANAEIDKMAEALKKVRMALGDGKFPKKELDALSEITVPFDTNRLVGKGTTLFKPSLQKDLISYASRSMKANELKDDLTGYINGRHGHIEFMVGRNEKPKFAYAAYVTNGAHGPMSSLLKLPDDKRFEVNPKEKKKDKKGKEISPWPEEIEIPMGDKKQKMKLYKEGNPISQSPLLIPVDPRAEMPDPVMKEAYRRLSEMMKLLKGDQTPQREKPGMTDLGKKVIDELKGIGVGG